MIKQRRLKLKQGKPVVKSLAQQRIDDIEAKLNRQRVEKHEFAETVNVTEIRNKVMMNNETKMTQEKLKGRFDLLINPDLPMETKIKKFLNEPIAFHLHKNRLFFQKIENKEEPPLTTKQILEKINKEMK